MGPPVFLPTRRGMAAAVFCGPAHVQAAMPRLMPRPLADVRLLKSGGNLVGIVTILAFKLLFLISARFYNKISHINGEQRGGPVKSLQKRAFRLIRRYWVLYLMFLPAAVYLLINNYLPMAGLIIAFKKINFSDGIFSSPWAGLSNFEYLFKTSDAWIITRNTLLYNFAFIVVNNVVGIAFAIMLNEIRCKKSRNFLQGTLMLPYLISMVIVSYLVYGFLSGESGYINNSILGPLGLQRVSWYSESKYWPFILTFVEVWKNGGYISIIYYSAIVGIDPAYYEAAALDGANKLQRIRSIVLPELKPVVIILVLLGVSKIFYSDFGLFYQIPMNSGALYDVTNTIDVYVYNALLNIGNIGMSSAAGFYQSVVGFVVIIAANLIVRKKSPENALF